MRPPPHLNLIPIQKHIRQSLLRRGIYQAYDIGCCGGIGGVGGVDEVRHQDGGVTPVEGVGVCTGEIFPIYICLQDEAWGAGWGRHSEWEQPAGKSIKDTH